MAVRPVCLVLASDQLTERWRLRIERAGYRIVEHRALSVDTPSVVVAFAEFAVRGPVSISGSKTNIPTVFVASSGAAVATDKTGSVHLVPAGNVDQLESLLRSFCSDPLPSAQMVGSGGTMRALRERISRVAASGANVLISGESGTGKELVASALHAQGVRQLAPLQSVNCAAIPETLVESELFGYEKGAFTGAMNRRDGAFLRANGGTLFLDEIGDMSLYAQAKVLRAIESRRITRLGAANEVPVDVRVVAASNRDLHQMMRKGTFRQDLYYRLAVVEITVPPLRNRVEDLPALVAHFANCLSFRSGVVVRGASEKVLALLTCYSWPGNVRELRNLVEASLVDCRGPLIELADLPETFCHRAGMHEVDERDRILDTLKSVSGNKSLAAKRLDWSRVTLYRKLAHHGIDLESETRISAENRSL